MRSETNTTGERRLRRRPSPIPFERRRLGARRPVRVGVIGAGYWGPNLMRNFMENAQNDLVVVADLDEERLAQIQRRFPGVRITTDYTTLFDMMLDAVAIATPPATHHTLAKACLEQGLHCLIEKPLATTVADAHDLIAIAHERDLRLMVGHTFEYNPAVLEIKRMIAEGELGDVFYIDAVRTNLGLFQLNTDAMWDLAPHDISIMNFLLDDLPIRVSAHGGSFVMREMEINDLVYLHLEYPGGRLANIRVSWLDPNKTRRTTVVGDRKMLVYDDVENLEKLRVYDRGVDTTPFTDTYGEFQCSYRYGDVRIPHISWEEPLRLEVKHFVESVAARTTPRTDGVSGLRVVEVLEAAERSLQTGRAVDLAEVRRPLPGAAADGDDGAPEPDEPRHDARAASQRGAGEPPSFPVERIEARE
jgi:predicted dehydrogenase